MLIRNVFIIIFKILNFVFIEINRLTARNTPAVKKNSSLTSNKAMGAITLQVIRKQINVYSVQLTNDDQHRATNKNQINPSSNSK